MKRKIHVDLIEDDEAVLDSLGMYLESKGFEVRRFPNASVYLKAIPEDPPCDCVVSDVRMPGISGLDLQKTLSKRNQPGQLILMTAFADVGMAVQTMKAGAFDFIEKPVDENRLVASIRQAASRAERLQQEADELEALQDRMSALTERETQVMGLATRGLTNREIAHELGISPRTVEIYRAAVMQKLRADSLADLVRMALQIEALSGTPVGPPVGAPKVARAAR